MQASKRLDQYGEPGPSAFEKGFALCSAIGYDKKNWESDDKPTSA